MIIHILHCKHKKRLFVWKAIHHEVCFESISKLIASFNEIQVPYFMNENLKTTGTLQNI